jgi:hypothetical protein
MTDASDGATGATGASSSVDDEGEGDGVSTALRRSGSWS